MMTSAPSTRFGASTRETTADLSMMTNATSLEWREGGGGSVHEPFLDYFMSVIKVIWFIFLGIVGWLVIIEVGVLSKEEQKLFLKFYFRRGGKSLFTLQSSLGGVDQWLLYELLLLFLYAWGFVLF